MTIADLVIVAVLALSAFAGFRRGLILEVAAIAGIFIALSVAHVEYPDARHLLTTVFPHGRWTTIIAYLLVFLVVWQAIMVIARKIRSVARLLFLGWLDRLLGALVGLVQGLLLVELLLYLGRRAPNHEVRRLVAQAPLTLRFQQVIPYLHHLFPALPT